MRFVGGIIHNIRRAGLPHRNFPIQDFCRRSLSGLFLVPAKPLLTYPNHEASLAVRNFVEGTEQELVFYKTEQLPRNSPSGIIGLALIDAYAAWKSQAVELLQKTLPPVPSDSSDDEALECLNYVSQEEPDDEEPIELPADLVPAYIPSGLLMATEADLENYRKYIRLKLDFNIGPEYKNYVDFDPDQDWDAQFYSEEVATGWLRATIVECSKGAKPRFYEALKVREETTESGLSTEEYLASASLSPCLFVLQIPSQPPFRIPSSAAQYHKEKVDEDMLHLFDDYDYLTFEESFRRISLFKQDNPDFPRWLLMLEFSRSLNYNHDISLKKKEIEYWLRRNGWDEVLVEAFSNDQEVQRVGRGSPATAVLRRARGGIRWWE